MPWGYLLLTLLAAASVLLPDLDRPYRADELIHNMTAMDSFSRLWERLRGEAQPGLEYVVRGRVWHPLFGLSEIGMRIPSLIYAAAGVAAAYWGAYRYFRRRGLPERLASALGLVPALWLIQNPLFRFAAIDARHYALIAAGSVLWAALALLADRPLGRNRAGIASGLLFANTHIFAWPQIAVLSLGEAAAALRAGWKEALRPLAVGALTVLGSAAAYWNVALEVRDLLLNPPLPTPLAGSPLLAPPPAGAIALARELDASMALPIPGGWMLAAVLALGLAARAKGDERRRLAVFLAMFVAPFLWMMAAHRIPYFERRFFIPLLGLGWAALCVATATGAAWARDAAERARWPAKGPAGARSAIAAAAVAAAAWAVAPGLPLEAIRGAARIRVPAANFSPLFRGLAKVAERKEPTLILVHPWWTDVHPRAYFKRLKTIPVRSEIQVMRIPVDSRLQHIDVPATRARLAELSARNPGMNFVLLVTPADCPAVEGRIRAPRLSDSYPCLWDLGRAPKLEETEPRIQALWGAGPPPGAPSGG